MANNPVRATETFIPLRDMDEWDEFYAANRDALDEIGDEATCRQLACDGGLYLGGGAAPLFYIHFVDADWVQAGADLDAERRAGC